MWCSTKPGPMFMWTTRGYQDPIEKGHRAASQYDARVRGRLLRNRLLTDC
jgi:hypothetical protein